MKKHEERAHSKFSASGAERWLACPGSVALSEGQPDNGNKWSIEGTKAHEILEQLMRRELAKLNGEKKLPPIHFQAPTIMVNHAANAACFMLDQHKKNPGSELTSEERVYLSHIHEEMFGTYDGALVVPFWSLDIYDFKYGSGHAVSPVRCLQMIFYAIGKAHEFNYNFQKIRLWIIQPRIKGYDGPAMWELTMPELREYEQILRDGVKAVEENPKKYVEGGHCHWCKAKAICPLKQDKVIEKGRALFAPVITKPEGGTNGKTSSEKGGKESRQKSEAQWREESKKGRTKAQSRAEEKGQKIRGQKEKQSTSRANPFRPSRG